jgi:hypothetical protein
MSLENAKRLKTDFNYFCYHCLKIKNKDGELVPLALNPIQMQAYQTMMKRKAEGKPLKFVFLKSRQVGLSTLTEAMLFYDIFWTFGKNAFVMSEKSSSTSNIFAMAKRYYDNLPEQMPKPKAVTDRSDMLELATGSSFRVGTAGSKSIGRSMTINYLHGSEVAFWENADEITSGLFQTVPSNNKSLIILESTANGVSGQGAFFYHKVMEGLQDGSDWLTLFYPWFDNPEYAREIKGDFVLSDEERELKYLYSLSNEQINWRRSKILSDFKGREYLFKQEYPSCIQEAFIRTGTSLIGLEYLEKARKNIMPTDGTIVIGVDPARTGDRTVIVVRCGRTLVKMYEFEEMESMRLAGVIAKLINYYHPDRVFIDYGHGLGTYDRLVEQGFNCLELVNFGESAYDAQRFVNRRAEMYEGLRDWFMQKGGVYIKDQEHIEELYADLMLMPDLAIKDSNGRLFLPPKDKIYKGTGISSPDYGDALALTFASFVGAEDNEGYFQVKTVAQKKGARDRWM